MEGADPIGDIFSDLLAGAGALLTEGIKIVTDVTDGSVSTSYSSNLTACIVIVKHFLKDVDVNTGGPHIS